MTRRIAAAIDRLLREEQQTHHIHSGPHGPYVCDHTGCTSPHLDPRDF